MALLPRLRTFVLRSPYLMFAIRSLQRLRRGQGPRRAALRNAGYTRQTRQVMTRVLRADSNCIDGGAHVGAVLDLMCELAPAGRHHAIEPLPHLNAGLERKFPRVTVHGCALGDVAGRASFKHVVNAPAYSGLRERAYTVRDPRIVDIEVTVARLDELIPADEPIAFIKLDLEGGEYHALVGGAATIRRCRPVIVFEAGGRSTRHYGVTGDMIFQLVTEQLELRLSTMKRWLRGQPGFDRAEFLKAYETEFMFIAYP